MGQYPTCQAGSAAAERAKITFVNAERAVPDDELGGKYILHMTPILIMMTAPESITYIIITSMSLYSSSYPFVKQIVA